MLVDKRLLCPPPCFYLQLGDLQDNADMVAHAGIIITVGILAAAALAAYDNEQFRAWVDRTRHKIAMGLHNLGDEIHPRKSMQERKSDASMSEEKGDAAEERRRQARQEIMERGRVLEERRKRRKLSGNTNGSQSSSFDSLVDEDGKLRPETMTESSTTEASATAVETVEPAGTIRSRHHVPIEADVHQSVDATIPVRHFPQQPDHATDAQDPFESMYEREMRTSWNLPLPPTSAHVLSSHASESLIDLTPTTEDFPDPDYSIPSAEGQRPPEQSDYFSAAASRVSSHTLSDHAPDYYYAHPSRPLEPLEPRRHMDATQGDVSISSAPSIAGSTDHVHASEAEISEDDLISEPDGIRTPGSAWTEVDSTISAEN